MPQLPGLLPLRPKWRRVTRALIPFVGVLLSSAVALIYLLQYVYVYDFLEYFGVSPEEVGITEIPLLTRAAFFTVILICVLGAFGVACWAVMVIAPDAARRVKKRTRHPAILRRDGLTYAQRDKATLRNRRIVLWGAMTLATFVVSSILTAFQSTSSGTHILSWEILVIVFPYVAVSYFLVFDLPHQGRAIAVFVVGSLVAILVGAGNGGAVQAEDMAKTGRSPGELSLTGIDVTQVAPNWIDKGAQPTHYGGEDLFDLGSNNETVFLYDCATQITYRVPLTDVVLRYPPTYPATSAETHARLHCRRGVGVKHS